MEKNNSNNVSGIDFVWPGTRASIPNFSSSYCLPLCKHFDSLSSLHLPCLQQQLKHCNKCLKWKNMYASNKGYGYQFSNVEYKIYFKSEAGVLYFHECDKSVNIILKKSCLSSGINSTCSVKNNEFSVYYFSLVLEHSMMWRHNRLLLSHYENNTFHILTACEDLYFYFHLWIKPCI